MVQDVKQFVKKLGADLVGIVSVETIDDEQIRTEIKKRLKDAASIIVFGRHLEDIMIKERDEKSARYQVTISKTVKLIATKLVRFFFDNGFTSKILSDPEAMNKKDRINIKKLAEFAGLGQTGFNTLLLTPKFGPRVLIATLVTEAILEPDRKNELALCLELKGISCKKCADACPQLAISFTGRFYEDKCLRQLNEDVTLYQTYTCLYCITACPIGQPDVSK